MMMQLEVDLALVVQHRRDASAPDPVPLEDIPLPELPEQHRRPALPKAPPTARDYARSGQAPPPALSRRPRPGPRPPGSPPSAAAVAAQRGGSAAGASGDVAGFIRRWNLDPLRSQLLLARLPPSKRREAMDTFRHDHKTLSPTAALEKYIGLFRRSGASRGGRGPRGGGSEGGASVGTKRPLSPVPRGGREPPSKRPREEPPSKRPRESAAIGAPRPTASASGSRPAAKELRSPPPLRGGPTSGGGSGPSDRAGAPPWRGAGAPPSRGAPPRLGSPPPRRPASSSAPPSRALGAKDTPPPLPRTAAGDPPPRSAAAPSRGAPPLRNGVLGASGASERAKPGDLIKSLLG